MFHMEHLHLHFPTLYIYIKGNPGEPGEPGEPGKLYDATAHKSCMTQL